MSDPKPTEQTTDEALEQAIEDAAEGLFQAYYATTYPGAVGEWSLAHEDTRAGFRVAAAFAIAHGERAKIEEAMHKMSDQTQTTGWQPIETAPKDGRLILSWPRDEEHATVHWAHGAWCVTCCGQRDHDVTHWMPLPEPPK